MNNQQTANLITTLEAIVGSAKVLTQEIHKKPFATGFRLGGGACLAVVLPQTLLQMWQVLQACVDADVIVIPQAANTGVTGGSTPDGDAYDRDIVIISTNALKGVHLLDEQQQVLAFPGTSLTELEQALAPHDREPHSVIGSSCIGASVIGGVCNNSGGSLIRRGPAFTEKSLFARVNANGELELVNELGIDLGESPQQIFANLSAQNYQIGQHPEWQGRIWADDYADKLRQVDADEPTRFNGNPDYLHNSAGCAGKLAVFAVRLPTFAKAGRSEVFYIGSHSQASLIALRRSLLTHMSDLPYQAEYIHRGAMDLTVRYARYVYKAVQYLGADKIPQLFGWKKKLQAALCKLPLLPSNALDKLIQAASVFIPGAVAPRIQAYRQQYEHHLMLKIDATQLQEVTELLQQHFQHHDGAYFQCNAAEAENAFLIRFGVGSCLSSYCDLHGLNPNERIVTFDVALRANDTQWLLDIPEALQQQIQFNSSCGHFFCYVAHQEFIVKAGVDTEQFKNDMLALFRARGAQYPAEHNVGHVYEATAGYQAFLQQLDPTNVFNPGIGKTSKCKHWH
ncbi:D-lactate dehydrogenase [Vitreoscilla massiliensis]|uniref:D-lactate dehydrogenase n=1 Tax=Vitreoscilla massiliensis TaxID=1689272 RepID=A0ABY4E4B5_9NEIS|nr:D-lactate dehydrogenase [Vitreoscilla massiliensis]UOO90230.1 D-lactate dehydrogenase [Vitreoscilla massiliensis]